MKYSIIASENFQPVRWSGGTTTELFIYPPTADYKERNFQFRLSTATVETEKSDFTRLSGISRKLRVLEGEVTLIHDDHDSRQLNKFDADEFEGDCETSSIGKCIDFNLMTTGETKGEITGIVVENEKHFDCNIKENCDWVFIYIFSGKISIDLKDDIITKVKGDLLILNKPTTGNLEIKGLEDCELVFSEVTL